MPIQTQKLGELPVILATYSESIVIEDIKQMYRDTEALLQELEGQYYLINDIRNSTTSFTDFIKIFESIQQRRKPHAKAIPQLIFVGTNDWINSFCQMMKRQIGINIPVLSSLEETLSFIEQDIANPD